MTANETIDMFRQVTPAQWSAIQTADAAWVRPPQSFIDRWNTACGIWGRYNEETGYFELNGLTDITYAEALRILNIQLNGRMQDEGIVFANECRTIIPFKTQWDSSLIRFAQGNRFIQILNLPIVLVGNKMQQAFYNCTNLRELYGLSHLHSDIPAASQVFYNCAKLERLEISSLKTSLDLQWSPLLRADSLRFLTSNASNGATKAIVLTLHKSVLAKIKGLNTRNKTNWTSTIWNRFIQTNHNEGISGEDVSGIAVGDILMLYGQATDNSNDYFVIGEVTGLYENNSGFYLKTLDGGQKTYTPEIYNAEGWQELMALAAEKNIQFASS